MSERVFIVGAGRAGRGLARALGASGVQVVGLHGTTASDDPPVTAGAIPPRIRKATVVLVTVRDAQLDAAITELTRAPLAKEAVVLHASGSTDPPTLELLRRAGHPCGTFHPLVPLADERRAADRLRGAWIGIDGDERARAMAASLARALGAHAVAIPPGEKPRYHAAAVFAANFPIVLAAIADRLLRESRISANDAWQAILHLMRTAVANVESQSPAEALTGPIARGDQDTVRAHVAALANDPEALAAYRALSRAALALARERGVAPATIRAMELALLGELAS